MDRDAKTLRETGNVLDSEIYPSAFTITEPITIAAQIISSDPALPMAAQAVTIYYDATMGIAGLEDCLSKAELILYRGIWRCPKPKVETL